MNRRTFLKTTAVYGTSLFAGTRTMGMISPRSAKAQEPIKILLCSEFSGPYATTGMYSSRGVKTAIDRMGGKVLGRPVEVIDRDAPNPGEAVRKAQEGVEKLGVKFIMTAPSSATALAVMEYAAKKGVFMIAGGGSDKITGAACNKFTFRRTTPAWGAVREVVPRIIKEYKANTFYTITAKYVFGEDLLQNTKEVLEEHGKKLIDNSYHPIGESDFSSHLTKAMAAKADCVLFLNFSSDTVNSIKQGVNFGLGKVSKIACAWGEGLTVFKAIGAKALEGTIWGLQYWHTIDTPGNNEFVKAFKEKYGEVPPYSSQESYSPALNFLQCIQRAGSTEPLKVVEAMEGYEYEGTTGPEKWRACDHQCIKKVYTVRCKAPQAMKSPDDFVDIIGSSVNYLPCEKTGCKMS